MVKARRPSRGADYLARERGLIRPRMTSSCASLFAEKGDPWLTDTEQQSDYPLSRSRAADKPLTADQIRRNEIYETARAKLEAHGLDVPKAFPETPRPSLHVDPDMDMFTKAERVQSREAYVDPKGKPVIRDHARWRANLLQKTRLAMAAKTVNVKEPQRKPEKIKGGFFVFDAPVVSDEKRKQLRAKGKKR